MADHEWTLMSRYDEAKEAYVDVRHCRNCRLEQAFLPGRTLERQPAGRWVPTISRNCIPGPARREQDRWVLTLRRCWARKRPRKGARAGKPRWTQSPGQLRRMLNS